MENVLSYWAGLFSGFFNTVNNMYIGEISFLNIIVGFIILFILVGFIFSFMHK